MFTVTVNTTVPTLTVVATAHQNTPLKWCLSLRHSQLGSFFPHHPLISYVWKVHPSWLPPSNRSNPKNKNKNKNSKWLALCQTTSKWFEHFSPNPFTIALYLIRWLECQICDAARVAQTFCAFHQKAVSW